MLNYDTLKIKMEELMLHPIFPYIFTMKASYKMLGGSKNSLKSSSIALFLCAKFLQNPNRHIGVFRKHESYSENTLNTIIWAFEIIAEQYDLPMLSPQTLDEHKKKNSSILRYSAQKGNYFLENVLTKQRFHFFGFNNPTKASSFTLKNPNHKIDKVWFEEIVDLGENFEETFEDDISLQSNLALLDTLFRGYDKIKHSWVEQEVFYSFNTWDDEHWIIKNFLDKFAPFDFKNNKVLNHYIEKGFFLYYDPKYWNNTGLVVARFSAYVNPRAPFEERIEPMRKEMFKSWLDTYSGATKKIGGLAYANHLQNLKKDLPHKTQQWPISIGIDYAARKDKFVANFLSVDTDYHKGAKRAVPKFTNAYFYDSFHFDPSVAKIDANAKGFESIDELLSFQVFEKIRKHLDDEYYGKDWEKKIMAKGLLISISQEAQSFLQTFRASIRKYVAKYPHYRELFLNRIRARLFENYNTKIVVESKYKVDNRLGRMYANRKLLANNMLSIDIKQCRQFYITFCNLGIDKKTGKIIDKDKDFIDAGDMALMPYHKYFNRVIEHKELKERYEEQMQIREHVLGKKAPKVV